MIRENVSSGGQDSQPAPRTTAPVITTARRTTAAPVVTRPAAPPIVETVQPVIKPAIIEPIKSNDMAWKPKTIAGKILKGVAIAGGSAVALGTGVGAIAGAVGGTGILAGAVGGAAKVVKTVAGAVVGKGTAAKAVTGTTATKLQVGTNNVVKKSVVDLITGKTAAQRQEIAKAKDEMQVEKQKIRTMEKLISIGIDESEARSRAGITAKELPEFKGEEIKSKGIDNKVLMYGAAALAALVLLPKIMKR